MQILWKTQYFTPKNIGMTLAKFYLMHLDVHKATCLLPDQKTRSQMLIDGTHSSWVLIELAHYRKLQQPQTAEAFANQVTTLFAKNLPLSDHINLHWNSL